MRILIDIPEELYNHTQQYEVGSFNMQNAAKLFSAIKKGELVSKDQSNAVSNNEEGEWIKEEMDSFLDRFRYRCSCCNDWQTYGRTKYCPFCGKKMKKDAES